MPTPATDHDLLIVLSTKMDGLALQMTGLQASIATKADSARVERLEEDLKEQKKDVVALQRKMWGASGALAAVGFVLRYFHV